MKRSPLRAVATAAASTFAIAAAMTTASAATTGGEAPTFRAFASATYQDMDGQYIVNGDVPARTKGDLRQFYDAMVAGPKHTDDSSLIVNTVNGRDDAWSQSEVGNLTYCVSTKFRGDHDRVAQAVADGAALWEQASSAIDFEYVPSQDRHCNTRNDNVVFSVEPSHSNQYIARAFFPSTPKRSQNVLVVTDALFNSGSWTPQNILGHELGHTLGFRHEHTRPEAGTCFEDNNWRPLTPYDSSSIMHYPQCNGTSDDLSFTSMDGTGARELYGN